VTDSERRVLDALGGGKVATFKYLMRKTGLSRTGLLGALLRLSARDEVEIEFFGSMYVVQLARTLPEKSGEE